MKNRIFTLGIFLISSLHLFGQTQFWSDDFEDVGSPSSGVRTPSFTCLCFGPPATAYFTRVTPVQIATGTPYSGFSGSKFWGIEDIDKGTTCVNNSITAHQNVTWTSINISGKTGLSFKGLFAVGTTTAFDGFGMAQSGGTSVFDYLIIQYRIDGGAWNDVLRFFPSINNAGNGTLAIETTGDSIAQGEGPGLTTVATEYGGNIPGGGTTLELRAKVWSNSAAEEILLDNFRLFETLPAAEINVQGNSVSIVDGDVTPSLTDHTDFGSQLVCSGSISKTYTIQNTGTSTLTISGVTITGTNAPDFSVTTAPAATVAPSGSTTFTVAFNPSGLGTRSATISITNDDANENPYDYSIQGTGIDPEINVQGNSTTIVLGDGTPSTIDHTDFGNVSVCLSTTFTRTYTIQNTGTSTLNITSVTISGANASDFSVTTAPSATVAPAGSTTFIVTFNPSALGVRAATITIANNDCDEASYDYAIQGTGIDPEINPQGNNTTIVSGDATPSLTDHTDFGTQSVCAGTIVRTYTIQNTGTQTLSIASVTISGAQASDYSVTVAPASTVSVAGSTTFQVTFDPSANGLRSALITIANNDCDEASYTWSIQGTGSSVTATPLSQNNVSCFGGSNGAASVSASGGTPAYTYDWAPGAPTGDGTASVTGLTAQVYTVTVTDAAGCVSTATFNITAPISPVSGTTVVTNVACFGGSNGTIDLTPTGGTPGYTYQWTAGPATEDRTGLTMGTYTVQITDANSCVGTVTASVTQPTSPVSGTTVPTNVSCFGGSNGAINLTPTGGSGGYTFNWLPSGPTTEDRTGLTAGTYTVQITDVNGCVGTVTVSVTQPTSPVSGTTVPTNVSCFGGSNGAINLTPSGGTPGYTFNWLPSGPTTEDRTGLTAGTYSVQIVDANGCAGTVTVSVTQPTSPVSGTTVPTNVSCFGGSNGAINLTPSGGTPGYTFNWLPSGPTTEDRTGLTAGTYSVQVTDVNGCVGTITTTVTQPTSPVSGTTVPTNVSCFGGSNGAINLTPTGGTPGYTFNWLPSGPTTEDRTGLTAGTYSVQIVDANGCAGTVTVSVTQPTSPVSGTTVPTNVSCFGGSNGAINLTPTGGTPGYTFNWLPSGPTTEDRTGLTAGTYSVQIVDANGCAGTVTVSVTQPTSPVSGTTVPTNVSCFGGSNGAINLTPSGGTPGYTFNWLPSGPTTEDRTGLTAGTYSVQITDANGCVGTVTASVTQPTSPVSGTTVPTNVSCFSGSNGAINLTPSGGTPGYTFNWLPSGPTTEDRTGLTAGTYSVQIVDANGCAGTVTVSVTQPTSPVSGTTVVTSVACSGAADGAINLTPAGGTPGYTFNWLPSGPTTEDRTGLTAGTYTVQITDANGCTGNVSATVTQPTFPLIGGYSITNVSCFGSSTGAINLMPAGGSPGYTYDWGGGITTQDRSGITAGIYTVVITDTHGCTATVTVGITQPPLLTASITANNVTCAGGNNGSLTAIPSGGTSGYTYLWSPVGGTAATASGLVMGCYTVTVTDANGCTVTQASCITQPIALSVTSSVTNVACNAGSDGSATVSVMGGTSPFTYAWMPSGGNSATAGGLAQGTYTCNITDNNGCTISQSVTITEPTPIAVAETSTDITCFGANNGSADVVVTGGTVPYTYLWSPSGGTASTATGLSPSIYACAITDANGCAHTSTFVINEPSLLTAASAATSIACNGGNATVTVTESGGTSPYTGDGTFTVTAGTYTYTVTDANGCTSVTSVTVTEPAALTATSSATSISCNGGNATVTVTGSGGTAPYTGAGTFIVNAGTYIYTVTDANGCTSTTSVTVTEPTALAATSSATSILCNGGSATVTVAGAGGTSPYTGEGTFTVTAGTYSYTVTDANGCTTSTSITVTEPAAIATSITTVDVLCNGGSTGSVDLTVSGGTGPYTYDWNSGTYTTEDLTGLTAGVYSGVVTDANGCTNGGSVTITEPPALTATVTSTTNPSACGATDGAIDITVSGGVTAYGFLWSNTANTEDISSIGAGAYTCTVTDANRCTATTGGNLNDPNAPTVTLSLPIDTLCAADGAITLAGESPSGGTFSGPGVSAGMFDPATAGVGTHAISYTFTDISGCTGSTVDSMYVDICLDANTPIVSSTFTVYPNPNNGTFTLQLNSTSTADVMIYDAQGKLVSTQKVNSNKAQITLGESGMYMITVVTADGQRSTQRVIVTQ